jgi:DNA-directed RNA polymerase subunit beta'
MAKPSGEIIEFPITTNFREGLSVLQYFISTHGARKGLADTALKTANSGYLTRRLVDVAQEAVITEFDCGTIQGLEVTALVEAGEVIERLGDRILGRTVLEPVYRPGTDEILVEEGDTLDEAKVQAIEEAGIQSIGIRSVLTCEALRGICCRCYGRDLARGNLVDVGEAVGTIAAQSIGEPGTQLTMRTFHIGGVGSIQTEQSTLEARFGGVVKFEDFQAVDRGDHSIVMNRHSQVHLLDEKGRVRERYDLVYGAKVLVKEGDTVTGGQLLSEWDPFTIPIICEVDGVIEYGDIIEGVTMQVRVDEVTQHANMVIVESRDATARPRFILKNESGETVLLNGKHEARYFLPVNASFTIAEGDTVKAGDVIAKLPRESIKTKDITGGLPRVVELFEARTPKDHAIISEIDGVVSFGKDKGGKRRVIIDPDQGDPKEYLVPKSRHLQVREGDRVRAGEKLMDGPANPHDILAVLGEKALARYLLDEIQEVYRLQGVSINDKHIEVIIRQMMRRVKIKDPGDTNFLNDDHVERQIFQQENMRVAALGGTPATGQALLLGITKASLSTESFLSASSFQETTKVLTEAALQGKVDYLRGLKENVIMGRLIPAGTGLSVYDRLHAESDDRSAGGEGSEPVARRGVERDLANAD